MVIRRLGLLCLASAFASCSASELAGPTAAPALLATIQALTAPAMEGRAAGSAGGQRAREYIEARFATLGLPAAKRDGFRQSFAFTDWNGKPQNGTNLLTWCQGRNPKAPAFVISAHYDHLGVIDGRIYPGADDNASGVALLLYVAERCKATPYDHSLLFAALDAEEAGHHGARALLEAPPIAAERIALNVNFDMVSRSERNTIYVAGPGRWPFLKPLLTPAVEDASITVRFGHDGLDELEDLTLRSDHGEFHKAGIPFVYLGVGYHSDYHEPTDTPEKIRPEFLEGVTEVTYRILSALDRAAAYR